MEKERKERKKEKKKKEEKKKERKKNIRKGERKRNSTKQRARLFLSLQLRRGVKLRRRYFDARGEREGSWSAAIKISFVLPRTRLDIFFLSPIIIYFFSFFFFFFSLSPLSPSLSLFFPFRFSPFSFYSRQINIPRGQGCITRAHARARASTIHACVHAGK